MLYNFFILSLLFIFSCASPIKITKIADKYPDDRSYQSQLIIYFSLSEIEYDYTIIASIQLENSAVYGNLMYDKRIKNYLLDRINGIGADALIYNDNLSDSSYTYFNAIHYIRHINLNPILIIPEEESN